MMMIYTISTIIIFIIVVVVIIYTTIMEVCTFGASVVLQSSVILVGGKVSPFPRVIGKMASHCGVC